MVFILIRTTFYEIFYLIHIFSAVLRVSKVTPCIHRVECIQVYHSASQQILKVLWRIWSLLNLHFILWHDIVVKFTR